MYMYAHTDINMHAHTDIDTYSIDAYACIYTWTHVKTLV